MGEKYYDADCDLKVIRDQIVAVIGYGSQGHAHALNLQGSGVEVVVGLRLGSESWPKATEASLRVDTISEAARSADVVMMLTPDEKTADIYAEHVEPHLKPGMTLAFAHGFNIHYGFIKPPEGVDVIMIAPKGPGHLVRRTFTEGSGVPMLIAVQQDESGTARETALSYASAIGGGRVGIIETTYREETETDLFGEQTVLCGGLTRLIETAFEVLVEAEYDPEMAFFECCHEVKLIVDLIFEGGMAKMFDSISNTAEYGSHTRGSRIIGEQVKEAMQAVLAEIQSGEFAEEWIEESRANGSAFLDTRRAKLAEGLLEKTGGGLRELFTKVS